MKKYIWIALGLIALLALVVFQLSAKPVYAHGTGLTFTATTTPYVIDVDYDSFVIESGYSGRFTYHIFSDAARTKPVDFDRVWVRIFKESDDGDETFFSGWIVKGILGATGMSYRFPNAGTYTMIVRYSAGEETNLAEGRFSLIVEKGAAEKAFRFGIEFWSGLCAGLFLALCASAFLILRTRLR
jgi:hypothetical protein